MKNTQDSLLKVLESFAFDTQENADRQNVLEKYIDEFPQFAAELKDFAIENDLLEFSHLEMISDAEIENHLCASRKTLADFLQTQKSETAEIASLYTVAASIGLKKRDLKERLGISTSLMVYLEKRRLEFESIPGKFIKKIAGVLGQTENSISKYLNQSADFAGQASFKTKERPQEIKQKSFAEAVNQDQTLTNAEKKELLDLTN